MIRRQKNENKTYLCSFAIQIPKHFRVIKVFLHSYSAAFGESIHVNYTPLTFSDGLLFEVYDYSPFLRVQSIVSIKTPSILWTKHTVGYEMETLAIKTGSQSLIQGTAKTVFQVLVNYLKPGFSPMGDHLISHAL
jgi:hypothetical protein